MEKLIKPAEYAKELGISRQAVYAKIKRGILASKNVDGKLYIVIDNEEEAQIPTRIQETKPQDKPIPSPSQTKQSKEKDYEQLLQAKDEMIAVLKGTVKDLKKSNKQITTTLRGEVELLKEAFHEMRTLYVQQLEHKKTQQETIDIYEDVQENVNWIGLKKFFKQFDVQNEKKQEKITKRFKKAYKNGDERFNKMNGKLKLNADENYEDILN